MYIVIPFSIFLFSILVVGVVIIRKFTYLKKISPETLENSLVEYKGFWEELLPEADGAIKYVKNNSWKVKILSFSEKILAVSKEISSKISFLIHKLWSRTRKEAVKAEQTIIREEIAEQKEKESAVIEAIKNMDEETGLKEIEQALIIGIAKSPRDPELYKQLGDIYIKTGEWDDARQCFEKALELNPRDIASRAKLRRILLKLKKISESE